MMYNPGGGTHSMLIVTGDTVPICINNPIKTVITITPTLGSKVTESILECISMARFEATTRTYLLNRTPASHGWRLIALDESR